MSDDGKSISLHAAAWVKSGMTEGIKYKIVDNGESYLVATADAVPGTLTLMIDKKTFHAIWGGVALRMFGMKGEGEVFECH